MLLAAGAAVVVGSCATGPEDEPGREPGVRIHYGEHPRHFGILRVAAGAGPHPVIVVIHGGCWQSRIATHTYMEPLAQALVAEGVATWNLEFRGVDDAGGGWPGTFQDVAAGIDHLRPLVQQHPLDLGRVAQRLVTGSEDAVVPPGGVQAYREAAMAAGDEVKLFGIQGSHFDVVNPAHPGWSQVRQAILSSGDAVVLSKDKP